ncbi:hypothetical protein ACVDG8_005160 [Mesorhizobium sp. ORM8.1]
MRLGRGCRLCALWAATSLALAVAPLHVSPDGVQFAKAYAGKGGGGGGNGGGGNGGNGGNGNGGNGNGGNGNGNSGDSGNGNGNAGGNSAPGSNPGDTETHVNTTTGDTVAVGAGAVEVTHPNGMKEKVEKGRFRMEDKYGRTIVDRKATAADVDRLKNL